MTHEHQPPMRLRDDPSFRAETGCDLADEASVVGGYDLARGRARLLAAIAAAPPSPAPAPAPPPAGPTAPSGSAMSGATAGVISTVAAALVTAAVWLASPEPAPERVRATAPTSAELPASPPPPRATPVTETPTTSTAPGDAVGRAPSVPAGPGIPAPVTAPDERVVSPPPAAPVELPATEIVGAAPPPTSALQADYQAFLAGDARLRESDWRGARAGFEAYLRAFPQGAMEPEARFGLLVAVFELGDAASAEAQARILQDRPEFSSRRSEIRRLRAESLVLLDRCEEALSLAETLASKDAAEVRRACRARRKEAP